MHTYVYVHTFHSFISSGHYACNWIGSSPPIDPVRVREHVCAWARARTLLR